MKKMIKSWFASVFSLALIVTAGTAWGEEDSTANGATDAQSIAKIGETYYETLQAAVDAATAGQTITVIKDVATDAAIKVTKKVSIDLNGKTVTSTADTIIVDGGTLTVTDSSADAAGKLVSTDASDGEVVVVKQGGAFTLEKGTIDSACYGIYVYSSGGTVTINGGSVTIGGTNKDGMTVAVGSEAGSLAVTGGTFKANGVNFPMYSWGGEVALSGGTYDFEPSADYMAYGYAATDNGDGTWSVDVMAKNIYIGETAYLTLAEAFAAANEGDTITITAAGEYIWPATAIPAGVTVKGTVEGVVATSDGSTVINATTLTVENIDSAAINHAAQVTNGKAEELTFTDCSFIGVYAFHVDSANNAKLTFNDCVFNGFTTFASTVANIDVNGGTINGGFIVRQDATFDGTAIAEEGAAVQIGTSDTVTNINVTMTDCTVADTNGDSSTPAVSDLVNDTNTAIGSGNIVIVDGDMIYGAVAETGGKKYASLAEAIAAAGENDVVKVITNVDTDAAIQVAKKVTIDLNGFTVATTQNDKSGDGVFCVTAGGELTIEDSVGTGVVNGVGGNNYNIAVWANGGKVIINGGTFTNEGATDSNGDNHFDLIYVKNGGSVEIYGGTFKCQSPEWTLNIHDGTRSTSSITVCGGSFYEFNPANCASEGEGTNFCADGYVAKDNGDGTYSVVALLNIKMVGGEPRLGVKGTRFPTNATLWAATNLESPDWTEIEFEPADDDADEYFWVKPTLTDENGAAAYRFFKLAN